MAEGHTSPSEEQGPTAIARGVHMIPLPAKLDVRKFVLISAVQVNYKSTDEKYVANRRYTRSSHEERYRKERQRKSTRRNEGINQRA